MKKLSDVFTLTQSFRGCVVNFFMVCHAYLVKIMLTPYFLRSGGIIGLGEAEEDRIGLLHTLSTLPTHPESVPINALIAVKGTPLENQKVILIF